MTSLLLPTAYLGGCIAAMSIFSHVYRKAKRKLKKRDRKVEQVIINKLLSVNLI